MTQEIILSLDESRVEFIKEYAEKKGKTVSEIVDNLSSRNKCDTLRLNLPLGVPPKED